MKKITAILAILFPVLTWAHPGHGDTDGYTIIHYFSEPQHAIITLGVLVAVSVYIVRERRKNRS